MNLFYTGDARANSSAFSLSDRDERMSNLRYLIISLNLFLDIKVGNIPATHFFDEKQVDLWPKLREHTLHQ